MPSVTYMTPQGVTSELEGSEGTSIMDIAVRAGLAGIVGECGGSLACSTCHVFVQEVVSGELPEMSELEDEMLDGTTEERQANSRLSCQLKLCADAEIRVMTPLSQI